MNNEMITKVLKNFKISSGFSCPLEFYFQGKTTIRKRLFIVIQYYQLSTYSLMSEKKICILKFAIKLMIKDSLKNLLVSR